MAMVTATVRVARGTSRSAWRENTRKPVSIFGARGTSAQIAEVGMVARAQLRQHGAPSNAALAILQKAAQIFE
ncbi:MAG: hypothetical protein ACRD5R_16890, partial [Candidatus Acidiferrales bacterium]